MTFSLPLRAPVAWLAFAATLGAQSLRPMPANADLADGHQSHALPFGAPGFRSQILVHAPSLAFTGGTIQGLRLRADRPSAPLANITVPNVTIQISQTAITPGTMASDFASNITGLPVTVFQGTVTLPPQTVGYAGPLPWNVIIPFSAPYQFNSSAGNLLIDIVGNNAPNARPGYWFDAFEAGGAAVEYGRPGDNPSNDQMNLVASTGPDLVPLLITPGNAIEYSTTLSFTHPPGALMLGVVGFPGPIDLTPFGAPTHELYIDPLVYVPHVWNQSFIGWYSTVTLPIPSHPSVINARLYAQSFLVDPAANRLGLLLSEAMETRIGDPNPLHSMQQLDAFDPAATQGTLLDFGTPTRYGAVAVLFDGQFQ